MRSEKAQRGPLTKDWKDTADPVMCCYKLVEVEFKWWGLQGTVESRVQKVNVLLVSACCVLGLRYLLLLYDKYTVTYLMYIVENIITLFPVSPSF